MRPSSAFPRIAGAESGVGAHALQPRRTRSPLAAGATRRSKQFREALRLDPDYAQAHNNLGAMLQLAGQFDEALDHYRRALALRPDNLEARSNLAQLLSRQGRAAEAADQFKVALAVKRRIPRRWAGWRGFAPPRATPRCAIRSRRCSSPNVRRRSRSAGHRRARRAGGGVRGGRPVRRAGTNCTDGVEMATAAGQPAAADRSRTDGAVSEERASKDTYPLIQLSVSPSGALSLNAISR